MHDSTSLTQITHIISTLNITIYTCMTTSLTQMTHNLNT